MIWRRIEVRADTTLRELHGIIQVAMGWEGIHLFAFDLRAKQYGSYELGARSPEVALGDLKIRGDRRLAGQGAFDGPGGQCANLRQSRCSAAQGVVGAWIMAKGWLIGVMVELADEPVALRHFFAVGHEDRARAEWKAIDQAMLIGRVAASPVDGLEPVHAIAELAPKTLAVQALKADEVRALGRRWPRRWLALETPQRPVT